MIAEERLKEIVEFALARSDKEACEVFDIRQETLTRYKNRFQNELGIDLTSDTYLREIRDRYSPTELKAIAHGKGFSPPNLTIPNLDFEGNHFRLGWITDTHIGSWYLKEKVLAYTIKEIKKHDAEILLHTGDVTDGLSKRIPGHIYELRHIGYAPQKKRAIELLGEWQKPLLMIDGNHDRWYKQTNNALIVEDICEAIPNAVYHGQDVGRFYIKDDVPAMMWHGGDGNSYATCVDDQTEILTNQGWKFFKALNKTEQVATLNPNNFAFEWQSPTDYINQKYDGIMLNFKARCFDLCVTPNHRLFVRKYPIEHLNKRKKELTYPTKSHIRIAFDWRLIEANDFLDTNRQEWQMTKVCSDWSGDYTPTIHIPFRKSLNNGVKGYHFGDLPIRDVAELVAWYVTEGYAGRKGALAIYQSQTYNPENHLRITSLLKRIGLNPCITGRENTDIICGSMELCEYLKSECGHLSPNKYLPTWLKNQSREILQIVFDTMIRGDGWNRRGAGWGYKSISKKLLDDLGEIAIKLGYGVTFSYANDTVCISKKQVYPTINTKPTKTNYSGTIYCVDVPNHIIMVRRNGKTIWTGNSYRIQKIVEAFSGGTKPKILFCGHTHKQGYFFMRNVHAFSGGCIQLQTPFLRGKRIPVHPGFWIIDIWFKRRTIKRICPTWYPFYA